MAAMLFDTLKSARELHSDFSQEQSKTLADAIASSAQDTVATRGGIAEMKGDLVRWIVTAIAFNFVATAGLMVTALKVSK